MQPLKSLRSQSNIGVIVTGVIITIDTTAATLGGSCSGHSVEAAAAAAVVAV